AELSVVVAAKRPYRRIAADDKRVPLADGDLRIRVAQRRNLDRRVTLRRRGVTELAKLVSPPRPDATVALDGGGMEIADRGGSDVGQARHLDRRTALRRRAITELAERIVAPCPHVAVARERHAVVAA